MEVKVVPRLQSRLCARASKKLKGELKWTILVLLFFPAIAWGADRFIKREVRGVWMATVYNIDWPSTTGYSTSVRLQLLLRYARNCTKRIRTSRDCRQW